MAAVEDTSVPLVQAQSTRRVSREHTNNGVFPFSFITPHY